MSRERPGETVAQGRVVRSIFGPIHRRVFEDDDGLVRGQRHLALELADEIKRGQVAVARPEWNARIAPTTGLLATVMHQQHTALVGDHLSAFARARISGRGLELSRFLLSRAALAIFRRGGIAGMKRAKLRQKPCRLPPRDREST